MARVKEGKNIRFYAHLKGLTGELQVPGSSTLYSGPVHIDEISGEILPGEERIVDLWWILFGVRFIGFDSIRKYEMTKKVVETNGTIKEVKVVASSLHFSGVYFVSIKDQEAKDGSKGDLEYTIALQTTNARESFKYTNWLDIVIPPAEATSRDYVSGLTVTELLAARNELSTSAGSFVNCMKSLNDDRVGNASLHKRVGQRVIAANLTAIGFDDKVAAALEQQRIAEETGKALVTAKRLEADSKKEEARGLTELESARTKLLGKRVKALAKPGGNLVSAIEQTKLISEATKEHEGTLVWGSAAVTTVT